MKSLAVFVLLLTTLGVAFAGPPKSSNTITLSYGWIRGADGKKHSVKGLKFEVGDLIPIQVKRVKPIRTKYQAPKPIPPRTGDRFHPRDLISLVAKYLGNSLDANMSASAAMFSQTIYSAQTGNYYALDDTFPDPSVLDDMQLSLGSGKLWEAITMGILFESDQKFLLRFQIFDDQVSGQGAGVSAFQNILGPNNILGEPAGDFGGYVTPTQLPGWNGVGSYIVQFLPQPNALWSGITCPDDFIYMAQQFRVPHVVGNIEDGEGAFDSNYKAIYNADVAPSVGSSQDGFWYDFDLNGIYDETEFEVLGDVNGTVTPFSNLLRTVTVSGTPETVNPASGLVFGADIQGIQWLDLYDSDDSYISFKPRYDVARGDPNGIVQVLGQMSGSSSVTKLTFRCEAAASLAGGNQKIDLWNWTTSTWDNVDSRSVDSNDTTVTTTVTSTLSRYINSQKRMQARIRFFPSTNIDRSYRMRVDQMNWTVLHP